MLFYTALGKLFTHDLSVTTDFSQTSSLFFFIIIIIIVIGTYLSYFNALQVYSITFALARRPHEKTTRHRGHLEYKYIYK